VETINSEISKPPKKIWLTSLILFLLVSICSFAFLYFLNLQKKQIKVVSDIPGISAELANKKEINRFLEKIYFWESNGIRIYETASLTSIDSLEIHLTAQEQKYGQFTGGQSKEVYQSFGQSLEENKLKLYLHFSPEKINKIIEQKSFEKLNFNLFYALYLSSARAVEKRDQIKAIDFVREYIDSLSASEPIIKILRKHLLIF